MKFNLKKTVFVLLLLFLSNVLISNTIYPAKKSTKEIQVIYVFDNKTKKLTSMLLFDSFISENGYDLVEKFKNHSFFTGFIKDGFKENKGEILPRSGSMFVILKDNSALLKNEKFPESLRKNKYLGADIFLPSNEFIPGDMFVVFLNSIESQIKVEVLKNNKSETVLKVL